MNLQSESRMVCSYHSCVWFGNSFHSNGATDRWWSLFCYCLQLLLPLLSPTSSHRRRLKFSRSILFQLCTIYSIWAHTNVLHALSNAHMSTHTNAYAAVISLNRYITNITIAITTTIAIISHTVFWIVFFVALNRQHYNGIRNKQQKGTHRHSKRKSAAQSSQGTQ